MRTTKRSCLTRREFVQRSALAGAGFTLLPYLGCKGRVYAGPMKRPFGRLGFEVTSLGLGGQASIQWTPEGVDPVKIILKAFQMGVNYFDTSNVYGPSQMNFGQAFRELDLVPSRPGYNESLRKNIFLTSKTGLRYARGGDEVEGSRSFTNGAEGSKTVDDVKRTLSQVFGDGEGNYPPGAYLDMVLIHSVTSMQDVDDVFTGYDNVDPKDDNIGALAALLDLREGTNYTGLNPGEERLINHIGFSGHYSSPVMMNMIRRDHKNILDGMLVAINANDRLYLNMQHNVIPVAAAKNMGIIAMKVFADGAMYTKEANWSWKPEHVVHTVGAPGLPSGELVRYSLTTPGIHTAIIGIGHIDDDPALCQLEQNLMAAQVSPDGLSASDRLEVEKMAALAKEGKTNYFQIPEGGLSPVQEPKALQEVAGDQRLVRLSWNTAWAGENPIRSYSILRDGQPLDEVMHEPQTTLEGFVYEDNLKDSRRHQYQIITVDNAGETAGSEVLGVAGL